MGKQGRTARRRGTRRLVGALVATAVSAAVLINGGAQAHALTGQAGNTTADALVRAGRVDPEVLDAVRKGDADAIVNIRHDDVVTANTPKANDGADGVKRAIGAMRNSFHQRKAGVFGHADPDVTLAEDYDSLPTSHVHIHSERALVALASNPDVQGIGFNRVMTKGSMDPESSRLVHQTDAAAAGYKGAGTYVAVMDTGIDITKPDFGSCTANFTPSTCRAGAYEIAANDGVLDDDGHGTNVSGIVAGMAPGARVLGLDVFNGKNASATDMNRGINWLVQQREAGVNIVAVNLSIWSKTWNANGSSCTDDLGFGTARSVGILPVVIAGNGGQTSGVSYPGCIPGALTVGAVYDSNVGSQSWLDGNCTDSTTYADKVVCFSQSGPNLKMLAPGSVITAAGITESGTSQAAPHVAGAAAVLAASRQWGTASAQSITNTIESALTGSGPLIHDRDTRYRHRLDVCAALASVRGQTACSTGDTTPPTVTAPAQSVALNWQLGTSVVPVTINWSASDASGIASYSLFQSTNGGGWAQVTLPSATATNVTLNLTPGSSYLYTVQAVDRAGNASSWTNGPTFRVNNYPENSSGITYSSGWTRAAWSSAYGGYLTYSGTAGASVSFSFTGRGLSWIATKDSTRGQAYVYLDGTYVGYWDLYSSTTTARVAALTANWGSSGNHTVKIVAVGTSGRPTIDVDSFLVLS